MKREYESYFSNVIEEWSKFRSNLIKENWKECSEEDTAGIKSFLSEYAVDFEVIPFFRDLKSDDVICLIKIEGALQGIGLVDLGDRGLGVDKAWIVWNGIKEFIEIGPLDLLTST